MSMFSYAPIVVMCAQQLGAKGNCPDCGGSGEISGANKSMGNPYGDPPENCDCLDFVIDEDLLAARDLAALIFAGHSPVTEIVVSKQNGGVGAFMIGPTGMSRDSDELREIKANFYAWLRGRGVQYIAPVLRESEPPYIAADSQAPDDVPEQPKPTKLVKNIFDGII